MTVGIATKEKLLLRFITHVQRVHTGYQNISHKHDLQMETSQADNQGALGAMLTAARLMFDVNKE